MNAGKLRLAVAIACCTALIASCDSDTADPESTSCRDSQALSVAWPQTKIDFLWVIDNSASMCEEQVLLARNFAAFVEKLSAAFDLDARVAVTTADAQCDPASFEVNSARGLFNRTPALSLPPSCYARSVVECRQDADCADPGHPEEADLWRCTSTVSESCLQNPNGTLNSTCSRRCTDDEDCVAALGPGYRCEKPSPNADDWGCMLPPEVGECPAELPPFLTNVGDPALGEANLDLFPCIATVGVNQHKCYKYEQGLRAALQALDPEGPNGQQAEDFLRDDAALMIIFVTDEDDCSVAEGAAIGEDDYNTCGLLPTTEEVDADGNPGKLLPISHFVERYRALKSDPSQVYVAAIAGDSLGMAPPAEPTEELATCRDAGEGACDQGGAEQCAALPADERAACEAELEEDCLASARAECLDAFARSVLCGDPADESCAPYEVTDPASIIAWERQLYDISKGSKRVCYHQTTICSSPVGRADFGRRYLELTEAFGTRGAFGNICGGDFGPALDRLADVVTSGASSLSVACLAEPLDDAGTLMVESASGGRESPLTEGIDFEYVPEGLPSCRMGGESHPSVRFLRPPEDRQKVQMHQVCSSE